MNKIWIRFIIVCIVDKRIELNFERLDEFSSSIKTTERELKEVPQFYLAEQVTVAVFTSCALNTDNGRSGGRS